MDMELVEVKTPYCMVCGLRNIITVTATAWARYASGTLIQDAFPEMSYDDREMLISGTHPKCWEVLHDEDYDDM